MASKAQIELLKALQPFYGNEQYYMPTHNGTKKFRTKTIKSMVNQGLIEVNQYNNYRLTLAGYDYLQEVEKNENQK